MSETSSETVSSTSAKMEMIMLDNAAGPKQVQGNAGMVTQHSASELIALDRYLASKKVTRAKRGIGIKFFALRPGRAE